MNYSLLFQKFSEHNIRYVICGGVAVNLHGIPRMTADIDIILDLNLENLKRFQQCTNELHYEISVPVSLEDIADEKKRRNLTSSKNLIALSWYNYDKNFMTLDVLLHFPFPFNELWERREVRKSGVFEINLVSIEDLILLKEFSGRIQDKDDIYFLSKIKNGKR